MAVIGSGQVASLVHRFERRAMGSPLRLTVVDRAEPTAEGMPDGAERVARAEAAWRLVSDEFEAAEQAMSRFRESSDLTALNWSAGTGRFVSLDRRLVRALVAADRAGRVTRGRFDARVLADLERLGYPGASVGPHLDVSRAPGEGGAPGGLDGAWLGADSRGSTACVRRTVDLGGIGKGLALRWAWRLMAQIGLPGDGAGALLEAGGDLVAGGPSPDGGPWIVGIEDPSGGREPLAAIVVTGGAIATSSVRVHHWLDSGSRPVHHLVDPRTGEPGGGGLAAVTVAGPDPAWAEVWSKTLFLEGADGIVTLARARGLAAWWIGGDGRLEMTAAARPRTAWIAGA